MARETKKANFRFKVFYSSVQFEWEFTKGLTTTHSFANRWRFSKSPSTRFWLFSDPLHLQCRFYMVTVMLYVNTLPSLILYFCSCFWTNESCLLTRLFQPLYLIVSLLVLLLKRKVFTSSFFHMCLPVGVEKREGHSKQITQLFTKMK